VKRAVFLRKLIESIASGGSKYKGVVFSCQKILFKDSSGKANTSVYARPHVMDEKTVAFIMAERLTHKNLKPQIISCF
jgi:hypothetical protein